MISKYEVKENTTLRDYLINRHISKSNIYKLDLLKAITKDLNNDKSYIPLDTLLKKGEEFYINFSLFEQNGQNQLKSYNYAQIKELDIIYETSELIAVDKRPGILIHSDGNISITLVDLVTSYLQTKDDDSVVRALHRLDVDTSGVVLFSKNILAHCDISYLIENSDILNCGFIKKYWLAVKGCMTGGGVLEFNIGKNRHNHKKYIVIETGKKAITKYKVLANEKDTTLIEAQIITGRPHQIRVTFAHLGYPIIGDNLYNKSTENNETLKLLAKEISFELEGKRIVIETTRTLKDI